MPCSLKRTEKNRQLKCELFSFPWWERFAVLWNLCEHVSCLAGLGEMSVEVSDTFTDVALIWESDGKVAVSATHSPVRLRLSATLANWESLVHGEFSPTDGVLRGRIRIEGDAMRLMGFVEGIKQLCVVARMVPQ
jgi:SCP-2 sterol transfer family